MNTHTSGTESEGAWRDESTATLWRAWFDGRSIEARNNLVTAYLPHAILASRMKAGSINSVDLQDAEQEMALALMEVISRYQRSAPVAFMSFAQYRIRGFFLEWQSRQIWPYQRLRSHNQQRRDRVKVFQAEGPKVYSADAIAWRMNERYANDRPNGTQVLTALADETNRPDARIVTTEWWELLKERAGLRGEEQMMVKLRWREDLTMKGIGLAVGVSESRISQLLSGIGRRIKSMPDKGECLYNSLPDRQLSIKGAWPIPFWATLAPGFSEKSCKNNCKSA